MRTLRNMSEPHNNLPAGDGESADREAIIVMLRSSSLDTNLQSLVNRCFVAADEIEYLLAENKRLGTRLGNIEIPRENWEDWEKWEG